MCTLYRFSNPKWYEDIPSSPPFRYRCSFYKWCGKKYNYTGNKTNTTLFGRKLNQKIKNIMKCYYSICKTTALGTNIFLLQSLFQRKSSPFRFYLWPRCALFLWLLENALFPPSPLNLHCTIYKINKTKALFESVRLRAWKIETLPVTEDPYPFRGTTRKGDGLPFADASPSGPIRPTKNTTGCV